MEPRRTPRFFFRQTILPILVLVIASILAYLALIQPWSLRQASFCALRSLHPQPPEAAPAIFQLLKDPAQILKLQAIQYFVAQTNPIVLPALAMQLNESDSNSVTEAISQLAVFGARASASVPRLRQLCEDARPDVRLAATNALQAITGRAAQLAASELVPRPPF